MRQHRIRVTRRGIQVTLGLLWILDGMLQLQPAMLTSRFATQVIAPAGDGQPAFVSWPVQTAARVIGHQPVLADLAFAVIQLALGAGLLYPRTARRALAASVAWALAVWYLGEGLGGLFGGGASLLTGAPGAALVYAVVAVAAAPPRAGRAGASDGHPARWTAAAWAALWIGGAVLQLLPGSDTNDTVAMSVAMTGSGAPAWLAAISNHLAALIPYGGVSVAVDLVVLQAFAGAGALLAGPGRAGGGLDRHRPVAGVLAGRPGPGRVLVGTGHRSGDRAGDDPARRGRPRRRPGRSPGARRPDGGTRGSRRRPASSPEPGCTRPGRPAG